MYSFCTINIDNMWSNFIFLINLWPKFTAQLTMQVIKQMDEIHYKDIRIHAVSYSGKGNEKI